MMRMVQWVLKLIVDGYDTRAMDIIDWFTEHLANPKFQKFFDECGGWVRIVCKISYRNLRLVNNISQQLGVSQITHAWKFKTCFI